MMIRWFKYLYVIMLAGFLFAPFSWAAPAGKDYTLPTLTPQLSTDGKTLYNARPPVVLVHDPNPAAKRVRIPPLFALRALPEMAIATFQITYVLDGGTDPWGVACDTFPAEAKAAFTAAAAILGNLLRSSVPITIRACWADLGGSNTLGYSGGAPLHRDFSGAPRTNTWYAGSLANALAGSDLAPSNFDMHITYNQNFSWYYGTDGNPSSTQVDLMTVVLHEIAHGLNFVGTMRYATWPIWDYYWGYDGYPGIYDTFMRDGSGNQLVNTGVYGNPSPELGSALTSNNIWFHGSKAMAANGGLRVKMYAPSMWSSGSSYSHLDYSTFSGTVNTLMIYAIPYGVAIHNLGPVTLGLLEDLGWNLPGDINGDGKVDMADAIASLQVLSGMQPAMATANAKNTVHGDGKFGLDEAIYILQKVAGLR